MKKFMFAVMLMAALLLAETAHAQMLKDMPRQGVDATPGLVKPMDNLFSSFLGSAFDENHFRMNHSYELTYSSYLGGTLGEYTNTMIYQFDIPLSIRADVAVMHQPFGQVQLQGINGTNTNAFSGVYLKNAEVMYRPTKDMNISIRFMQVPNGYYNPYGWGNQYGSPFGNGMFNSNSGW